MIDGSALIRLSDSEHEAYRVGGRGYIDDLATSIAGDPPHREQSGYHERDLTRGPDAKALQAEVQAAIVNHTWLAEQRRPQ